MPSSFRINQIYLFEISTGNQQIKIQLLGEELPVETVPEDEVSLCTSVRCTPSGLKFKEPIKLTFNHCSELTQQVLAGEGELILYSRDEDEDGKGNWNLVLKRSNITKPCYNKVILLVPILYNPLFFTLI